MTRREKRLMLQTAYCAISVIALVASFGFFEYKFQSNWYIFFTNLTNYYCMGFMALKLRETIRNRDAEYNAISPHLEFVGVVLLTVTFFIFNFVIAPSASRDPAKNVAVSSVLLHEVLPPLFLIDWFLSHRRGQTTRKDILLSLIPPIVYFLFIELRAPFVTEGHGIKKYPYFFLNLDQLGYAGLAKWFCIVLVSFLFCSLFWYWIDHLPVKKKAAVK